MDKRLPKTTPMMRDLKLLNLIQQRFGVYFLSSTVDANENPPVVVAQIRLPRHKTVHKVERWETTTLKIKVDRMLRRVIREMQRVLMRRDAGFIHDITINCILLGLYGSNFALWTHRSLVERSLKQLPLKSKIRKYVVWRLSRLRALNRQGEFP